MNLRNDAFVQVSCITATRPYRPHPHLVVHNYQEKKVCERSKGFACAFLQPRRPAAEFSDLKIHFTPMEEVKKALDDRVEARVNPFRTPQWQEWEYEDIDLTVVRLCFQVMRKNCITMRTGQYNAVEPVVTEPIYLQPPANMEWSTCTSMSESE